MVPLLVLGRTQVVLEVAGSRERLWRLLFEQHRRAALEDRLQLHPHRVAELADLEVCADGGDDLDDLGIIKVLADVGPRLGGDLFRVQYDLAGRGVAPAP